MTNLFAGLDDSLPDHLLYIYDAFLFVLVTTIREIETKIFADSLARAQRLMLTEFQLAEKSELCLCAPLHTKSSVPLL